VLGEAGLGFAEQQETIMPSAESLLCVFEAGA